MKTVTEANEANEANALITMNTNATELSIRDIKGQITKVQTLMRSVMKDGVHFGAVPGIPTKFLFKAGAEKLCMTFRLIPEYKIDKTLHERGHITYDITTTLRNAKTGQVMGQGVGTCSTLERKYRYRNDDIATGVEVPSAWWNSRNMENLPKILKNSGVIPKTEAALKKENLEIATGKINGKFQVVYRRKIDNPDIADVYNTVIKMAKKRALVDATITTLSVSDMFSQDPDVVIEGFEEPAEKTKPARPKKKA